MPSKELAGSYNSLITKRRLLNDPLSEGWTISLREVSNAYVLPQTSFRNFEGTESDGLVKTVYDGGVYRSSGEIVESSLHITRPRSRNIPLPMPPCLGPETRPLKGCWLFGGILKAEFGHTLTEGLGRLWGLHHWPGQIDGVVFVRFNGGRVDTDPVHFTPDNIKRSAAALMSRSKFIPELLQILTDSRPIHLVGAPVRVEKLVVPSQLMGLVIPQHMGGHEIYRRYVKTRFEAAAAHDPRRPRRKLYVSRSKMSVQASFFFMEDYLENMLVSQGYEILHPQTMSIAEQARVYQEASHVIIGTGSAAHMLALVARPEQRVMLLHRHRGVWMGFGQQLSRMGVDRLTERDYTNGRFVPVDEETRKKLSLHPARTIHSLDFHELWKDLLDLGYVTEPFIDPPITEVQSSLEAILAKLSKAYHGAVFRHESLDLGRVSAAT